MKRGQHKLDNQQVLAIFVDRRLGKTIASDYGISGQMVSKIKLGQAYMELTKLPPRREGVAMRVEHRMTNGEHFGLHVTANIDPSGRVREVFCANPMTGSDLDALLTDGAILISLLLQGGVTLAEIGAKLGEVRPESGIPGAPASAIGTIVRAALVIENELDGGTPS